MKRPPTPFEPAIDTLPVGHLLYRVFTTTRKPEEFNPGVGGPTRFGFFGEPPVPIMCAAETEEAAIAETLLHNVPPEGGVLSYDRYSRKALARLAVTRDLHLAVLHGFGLRRLKVSADQVTSSPASSYPDTVRWAEAAYRVGHRGPPAGPINRWVPRLVTGATAAREARPAMAANAQDAGYVDVVIIGAGISGLGAAYRITERNPHTRYVILERRAHIGGTWDLFRYPGVRSDSSIYTLSLPFEPWTGEERVADGDRIRDYLTRTAHKYGIDDHIRFNSYVRSAEWDSSTDTWAVTVAGGATGQQQVYHSRFVFFGSGYYNYDEGYNPDFDGIEQFRGTVAHPQHWPQDLDYTGKNMVVIGSGATAMSLIPSLAERAAKVTMLQRTPTYLISVSRFSRTTNALRKLLPARLFNPGLRMYYALFEAIVWFFARKTPRFAKWVLRQQAVNNLPPGYDVDTHFRPPYNPWDQRLCLIPDADMYAAISDGRVEVVTDHIDHIDATGIVLRSGGHLDADVIVTATGLQLQALGGVRIILDGTEIKPADRFVYKAHMLDDVPNLFWCVGYTNASWTLRADMTARATAKLLSYMAAHGYTHAYPHRGDEPMAEKPSWDIQAGYVQRSLHALPKSGTKRPWNVRQNYFADAIDYHLDRITESMVFGRAADRERLAG